MISRSSSLIDVAYEVCTALDRNGVGAVLTGGSAATFYTEAYRSNDVDFVISFGRSRLPIEPLLASLGFIMIGSHFEHPNSAYTLDFPPGPLGVGSDTVTRWDTACRDDQVLHVISRTDSVRDRLAGFYHWNDRNNLRVALLVASSGPVDLDLIRDWSERERSMEKFNEFLEALQRQAQR